MKKFLYATLLITPIFLFSQSYHAFRLIFEYYKDQLQIVRYEEVFCEDGNKIVFVKVPKKVTWVKFEGKYYIGTNRTLKLSPPINDLEDIFYKYLYTHKISEDFDGEITISEKLFTIKAEKKDGMIKKIIRKFNDILTEMHFVYLPSNLTFEKVLSTFQLINKSDIPLKIYNILDNFLWFSPKVLEDDLEIYAVDKNGEEVILLLSKKKGTYKINDFYLTIKKASKSTREEIENEIGNLN
ncbi:hypothetical protein SU69_03975 [Thermosipho melanesiensis]|uniref:Uncharacterized protein n=2 Tax=Thermosipho melanesiensis TaxID=46541 RepID=A6LL36_THEM4|nr:hypothetical protein [Thermosipho melanesiensis]ABR30637.1 hypothetical protein Tmel_0775 [Thermosipho melanesiensis BI429]APT73776.1 hypothetical protein BW47_04185 [Thermosipho melanesiensis]OOC35715.1 hypothetical protein SU68_04030 [Thermosipho melanesiensis]OOC39014.1 hypothetical protein SU69_03975 [Thermosipho melanesiensis]OOC39162.1 hypothetical protein SU70_03975 [Thermosipho melanesiensis]